MKCKITKSEFGVTPKDEQVYCFTLSVRHGLTAKVINFGGIVTELHVPDTEGNYKDVVLGFDNLEAYFNENTYAGAIVGRIAGRLTKGQFFLNGVSYQLTQNENSNHLHGGNTGLDKRIWSPEILKNGENESLKLTYTSPDGEEGYPGTLNISVVYSIPEKNILRIAFEATTDRPTPFCPTSHNYFNLEGESAGSVVNHWIQINSDKFAEVNDHFLPIGSIKKVKSSENDFRKPARLGDRLDTIYQAHGDFYLLQKTGMELTKVAKVQDPVSGRGMEVYTTASGMQFYTGMGLQTKEVGKSGRKYDKFAGMCFECQEFADAPNHPNFKSTILCPDKQFCQITEYRFVNKESVDGF